jgi:dTDP-4-dehydrorhamnose 3,5-epimerase
MHTTQLALDGLRLIELDVHGDERGFFIERFNLEKFQTEGLPSAFVQDNHSRSLPGVVRGLHYQHTPPQGKLVGVMRGLIWDVVVDIRPGSATFGESCSVELSDMNGRLLWVPPGFAHGFCVLDDTPADLLYKVDTPYNPDGEAGILWSDQTLNIPWPIRDPIVSTRDQAMPTFAAHRLSHAM